MRKRIIAKALLFNDKDELLLLRRSATDVRRPGQWDIPGGNVDPEDESYQAACTREITEESGLGVKGAIEIGYAESACVEHDGDYDDITWMFFVCKVKDGAVVLSHEHDDYRWMPLDEALHTITYDRQLRALSYVQDVRQRTDPKQRV